MTIESVLKTLSIVISSLILALGLWLLAGWYIQDLWPANVRYPLGGVMTLYAIYRILTAPGRFKKKDADENSDVDEG
jgi:membrane protein YdbS with pleckstrin-like domain